MSLTLKEAHLMMDRAYGSGRDVQDKASQLLVLLGILAAALTWAASRVDAQGFLFTKALSLVALLISGGAAILGLAFILRAFNAKVYPLGARLDDLMRVERRFGPSVTSKVIAETYERALNSHTETVRRTSEHTDRASLLLGLSTGLVSVVVAMQALDGFLLWWGDHASI